MNIIEYISNPHKSTVTSFCGTDNGINQNTNWNIDFDYRWNSLGFRGVELEKNKKSIITFGCSHTVGVGIPEHMRFSRLIADKLNLEDYNFGCPGGDHFVVFRNILNYFKQHHNFISAEYAFILWPDPARFTWAYQNNNQMWTKTELPTSEEKEIWIKEFMYGWSEHACYPYQINMIDAADLLFRTHGIKLKQLSLYKIPFNSAGIKSLINDEKIYNEYGKISFYDHGRDSHPGPKTHQFIADSFVNSLID